MTDIDLSLERGIDHAGLRQRVQEIKTAEKKSIKDLAAEAGIANGTFSNWLGDTYQGDVDKFSRQVQTWLDARPTRSRVQAAMPSSPEFMDTMGSQVFTTTLEHAQYMPDIGLIIGAPGTGKTVTARAYQKRNPNVWLVTAEPCGGSARAMLELVAGAMSIATSGVSATRLSWEIARRMRGVNGLLIVDEAQHLTPMALDQLRTLYDQANCGVALVGNETIYARLDGGGRSHFAQLTSRVGMRTVRMKPLAADVGSLLDAWKVRDPEMRRTLHAIANKPGALRLMDKVLRFAHKVAAGDEATGGQLMLGHLQEAYARLSADDELRPGKGSGA